MIPKIEGDSAFCVYSPCCLSDSGFGQAWSPPTQVVLLASLLRSSVRVIGTPLLSMSMMCSATPVWWISFLLMLTWSNHVIQFIGLFGTALVASLLLALVKSKPGMARHHSSTPPLHGFHCGPLWPLVPPPEKAEKNHSPAICR